MDKTILIKEIQLNDTKRDILIKGNRIEKISDSIECNADKTVEGKNRAVIPGFMNMHTHAAMTLMRGIGEDMSLMDWLYNKIWPIESRLDEEMVYWGTKLACLEMFKSGTTFFNDQYWYLSSAVKAASEMGIRSLQPFVILDLNDKSRSDSIKDACIKAYNDSLSWGELNRFSIGVHSPYSVSREMLLWGAEFAAERNLILHIHISETEKENSESLEKHGLSPVKYLDKLGILSKNVIGAHCLWLDDEDIEILAKRGVTAVHNINSNLKIASGYRFRYNELRDAGVTVTLGTDGCASSNNLDMLETMKTTALVQKGWRGDPTAMPLNQLMDLSTRNAGKALGIDCGEIKEGALADMVIIDTSSYAFTPNINFLANLIYSANSSCVESVICNGVLVMENREVKEEEEILFNVNRLYKKLL